MGFLLGYTFTHSSPFESLTMEKSRFAENSQTKCTIHVNSYEEDDQILTRPLTYDSWLTLLEAAKVRNYSPVLDIAD